jgi:xylulokinase
MEERLARGAGHAYLLGIDLGTSGVKVMLLPADAQEAKPVAEATEEYPLFTPRPGWSEQNPADWWSGVTRAVGRVLDAAGIAPEYVAALALSGQMHGATLLDARGEVLRPCILWNDTRSGPQCMEITERVGGLPNLVKWVANPALAGFTAPKILWVREHEPEIYSRLATVLLPKDYINYRLTGELATEVSDASGTLLFDVAHRRWSEEMLRALDLPASILPPVHASTEIVGRVTAEAAAATSLAAGTSVVAGGADNACAAVGLGVIRDGQVATSIGTSGTVIAPSADLRLDPQARLHAFCHAVPDTWYLMGVVLSAGGSLRWFCDMLASEEVRQAAAEGRDPYDVIMEEAQSVPAGSEGLFFLPYLSGERTPHGDPNARGVFFGLSLRHTRAHMARSVIEGVTFALADSTDIMRGLGLDLSVVRATGGGARSPFWRQLQADVLNVRVVTALADVGPAFGAAILAGVGAGVFDSVAAATDLLVHVGGEIIPNPAPAELYRKHHALYDRLYGALRTEFTKLARL